MTWFNPLSWFGRKRIGAAPTTISPDQVLDDDPMMREIVSRCWNSASGMVEGVRKDDGSIEIREIGDKDGAQ